MLSSGSAFENIMLTSAPYRFAILCLFRHGIKMAHGISNTNPHSSTLTQEGNAFFHESSPSKVSEEPHKKHKANAVKIAVLGSLLDQVQP